MGNNYFKNETAKTKEEILALSQNFKDVVINGSSVNIITDDKITNQDCDSASNFLTPALKSGTEKSDYAALLTDTQRIDFIATKLRLK